jgi:hypothetical protein
MATTMVETFKARREVNLGWCKRQNGDFIPEYTDDNEIEPRARERLLRMGYIERRTVSQDELDAWKKAWDEQNAPKPEGSSEEDGETSEEETSDFEEGAEEEAPVIPVVEESIEDLGPVEEEAEEVPSAKATKKVVRAPRNSRRRS